MLYVFRTGDRLSIAWDSRAPQRATEDRLTQLDTRRRWFGFIRTGNAG
ncbi:hypothetical protein SAMN05880590_105204 [Rhizobium sp. RU35A]|nr:MULTISPECIES: hypothetical protein [Rhizobium]SIQ57183.1 hypothetical protein SAMN05880590_105204 [Rhizobium sp. RU35A]